MDESGLLLLGGIALIAAFAVMNTKNKESEDKPSPEVIPDDESIEAFADKMKTDLYDAMNDFNIWQSDPEGVVRQTVERCNKLVMELQLSSQQGVWPISERLATRVGNMQTELERVISVYQGRVQKLSTYTGTPPEAFLARENYRRMVWQLQVLHSGMLENDAEMLKILKQKNVINNHYTQQNLYQQQKNDNRAITFDQTQVNQYQQNIDARTATSNKTLIMDGFQSAPGLVTTEEIEAGPLQLPPTTNPDMEVDQTETRALAIAQPSNTKPLPVGALAPVEHKQRPLTEDPNFNPNNQAQKRRKTPKGPKLLMAPPQPQEGLGIGQGLMPNRPEIAQLGEQIMGLPNSQQNDLFASAPASALVPANSDEANLAQRKRKRNSPNEFTQVGGVKVQKPDTVAPDRTFLRRLNDLCEIFNDALRSGDRKKTYQALLNLESLYPDGGPNQGFVELQGDIRINGKAHIKMSQAEWQQIAKMTKAQVGKLKLGDSVKIITATEEMKMFKVKVGFAQNQYKQMTVVQTFDA